MKPTRKTSRPTAPATGSLRLQLTRGDIVRASIDVFERLGADATRVEDLLDAADVARRTFYKHFHSKDDVLTAVYDLVTRELLAAIDRGREASADPTAGVRATLDVYLGFHVDNHRILRVLVEQALRSESPLAPLRRRFRAELVRTLDEACRAATGRALDLYVFLALLSGLEGLSLELLSGTPSPTDVARAREVMHGMLDAVLRAAPTLPAATARDA